jgi:2-oxoisovalerate dehydrogenase E2 component (dihydrolipoyl transacylase)
MKLHDVGEGVAEAEIIEWRVQVGDSVTADDVVAEVMSDKATVELYSPVDGTVSWRAGEVGDIVAVGAELLKFDTAHTGTPPASAPAPASAPEPPKATEEPTPAEPRPVAPAGSATPRSAAGERTDAAPAVRARARALGIDLSTVRGTGPEGRIIHGDLDSLLSATPRSTHHDAHVDDPTITDVKITGLRRNIAERMKAAKRRIPHFTYVEEVDVTELERLRARLNAASTADDRQAQPKLTILPFLMRAVVLAVRDHPEVNARFDDEAGIVHQHSAVHLGIATQTSRGLMVPVVKSAGALDLWQAADEVVRLSEAARNGKIKLDELNGSTITITSLGALGGIVSTPVINAPEVAIVGVNKISTRPVYVDGVLVPRQIMNLSSSFDHRIIDGVNAASFVQDIKRRLETPALLWTPLS